MLLGTMPEDSAPGAILVPTVKNQRATDFSIAAIMARGASPPDSDALAAAVRETQSDGESLEKCPLHVGKIFFAGLRKRGKYD